jgi:hypothetical protein
MRAAASTHDHIRVPIQIHLIAIATVDRQMLLLPIDTT